MAIEATYDFKLKVVETLGLSQDLADDPELIHQLDTLIRGKLDANSAVPGTKVWSDTRSLSGGDETLDLTALTRGSAPTVDFTGLKVQMFIFAPASTNTGQIIVGQGAANPYFLFVTTGKAADVSEGGALMVFHNERLADVSATVKNIRIQSADLDATYSVILVAG